MERIVEMRIEIWLHNNSKPIVREAEACYEKGSFYCVLQKEKDPDSGIPFLNKKIVEKWPIVNIWKVKEDY